MSNTKDLYDSIKAWFDDEDDIDWNDEGADCIHSIQKYGV